MTRSGVMAVTMTPLAAGVQVSGYRIESLLGSGGAGRVYLAHDPSLQRPVALKVVAARIAADPVARRRLLQESRLAARLDHPHVVPVYSSGTDGDTVFVAMRYVPGGDLREQLRSGPLSPDEVQRITTAVAAALDAAHSAGLVHRDVKPANVLLDENGHVYLTDFGLATDPVLRPEGARPGFVGTLDYVAPEVLRGDPVDARTDVYSLGCTVFEMLTGIPPFRRQSDVSTLFAHLEEPPPLVHATRPELPAGIDAVLDRALAKAPADRFESCGALAGALRTALSRRRARRRSVVVAAAGLLVAATAAGFVAASSRDGSVTAVPPAGALVRLDPGDGHVVATAAVPGHPGVVAVAGSSVWAADLRGGALWRLGVTNNAVRRVASPGEPRDLVVAAPYVYVASDGPDTVAGNVARYAADSGERVDAVMLELPPCALGDGDGVVWAATCPYLTRLTTGPGKVAVATSVPLPYASPATAGNRRVQFRELVVAEGSVWVLSDGLERTLWRLDERTGKLQQTYPLGFVARSVAATAGVLWLSDPVNDAVHPLDIATGRLLPPVPVGRGVAGVAAGAGHVWVANGIDGTVSRIDAGRRAVDATVAVGQHPHDIAVGPDAVWVSTSEY